MTIYGNVGCILFEYACFMNNIEYVMNLILYKGYVVYTL